MNGKKAPPIYFDNAASSKRGAYLAHLIGDLLGKARSSVDKERLLLRAESRLAALLGTDPKTTSISFVPNATYGLNQIAYFYTETRSLTRPSKIKLPIYLGDAEHASNHLMWLRLASSPIVYLPAEKFREWRLPTRPAIFSFACATNLEGIKIPIDEIDRKFSGSPHICIVDASQMMQYEIPRLGGSGISHLVFTAHKCFGPNGLGVVCSQGPEPVGINSSNCRTMNYDMDFDSLEAWINGMDVVEEMFRSGFVARETARLRRHFADNFPKNNRFLEWLNPGASGLIFLLEVRDRHISAHDYAFYLGLNGVVVRAGLSCSWMSGRRFDGKKIIRVSLGPFNSVPELDRFFRLVQNFSVLDCL